MSEYPEDVMKAAENAALTCFDGTTIKSKQGKLAIARAIMAERERAARICEGRLPLYADIGQKNAVRECASSIRA